MTPDELKKIAEEDIADEEECASSFDEVSEAIIAKWRKEVAKKYRLDPNTILFSVDPTDDAACIVAHFKRKRTPEEVASVLTSKKWQQEQELKQYEELKKKYG